MKISLDTFMNTLLNNDFVPGLITFLEYTIAGVDWMRLVKVTSFFMLAMLIVVILLYANDRLFDYYKNRRVKVHHLTLRNNGNTPSVFLLRTVDLPENLAIRFMINGAPMIWVSKKEKKDDTAQNAGTAPGNPAQHLAESDGTRSNGSPLIPNLSDPMRTAGNAVSDVTKTVAKGTRKVGLIAGIIGSITNLLPNRISGLDSAQSALKDIQSQTNSTMGAFNTKISSVNTLSGQVSNLVPNQTSELTQTLNTQVSAQVGGQAAKNFIAGGQNGNAGNDDIASSLQKRGYVHDEQTWLNNIGKRDSTGGALNYAQSKILQPGESMKVDLEIMNLSESTAPESLLYKIEILQIPQTKLELTAPSQFVSGIVIYPKISQLERILPPVIMIGMMIIGLQLLAGYSYWIF